MSKRHARRGFAMRDLAAGLVCLVIAVGLLAGLGGASRNLSRESVCAGNLSTLHTGLLIYVNQYRSFPPHNPYPAYAPDVQVGGLQTRGWDPSLGWILTYGVALTPPATFPNGHFQWFGQEMGELPSVVVCPAANLQTLAPGSPEVEPTRLEGTAFRYAMFYQTSGMCRAATRIGTGGTNPYVPDPTNFMTAKLADNAVGGVPYVYVLQKPYGSAPSDPTGGTEMSCWVQATEPSAVDDPDRVYYLADSRDYRPTAGTTPAWPPAGINDGWLSGYGKRIYLGSRHVGWANVMYLDGRVSREGQAHSMSNWWDANLGQWRCSTFATQIRVAGIETQGAVLPRLMVKGWEYFLEDGGVTTAR